MFKTALSIVTSLLLVLVTASISYAAPTGTLADGGGLYALLMSTLMTFGLLTVLTILIYRRSD